MLADNVLAQSKGSDSLSLYHLRKHVSYRLTWSVTNAGIERYEKSLLFYFVAFCSQRSRHGECAPSLLKTRAGWKGCRLLLSSCRDGVGWTEKHYSALFLRRLQIPQRDGLFDINRGVKLPKSPLHSSPSGSCPARSRSLIRAAQPCYLPNLPPGFSSLTTCVKSGV